MVNQIIGIAGLAGVGKDTVASILVSHHGFITSAFADPLREVASTLFNIPVESFLDRQLKDSPFNHLGISRRDALKSISDALKPAFGQDMFVRCWVERNLHLTAYSPLVVSDVRLIEEVNALRKIGAHIIYIDRPGVTRQSPHATEGFKVELADTVVVNDGTIDDLIEKIGNIVDFLKENNGR